MLLLLASISQHLFCRKHLINNIQLCFFRFAHLNLFFSFVFVFQLLTFKLVWYQNGKLCQSLVLLLQHGHRSGVKPHRTIASFCSLPSALLGIILQHLQPGDRGDSIAPPTRRLDSHDSGRPSATAQIRDQLPAPWLDLTIQRAGGLSTEVSVPLPVRHMLHNSSVSHFCSVLALSRQEAVRSD